jgi:rhodanese-related sulfurtransferase
MKKENFVKPILLAVVLGMLIFASCGSKNDETTTQSVENESQILLEYLTQNGDYINGPDAPAIITAEAAFALQEKNTLFVDLREKEQFDLAHISGAVNVEPAGVLEYFTNAIDAPSFDNIVFVCNRGQLSAYVTGIMRLLGYDNTYSFRFGLSGWNLDFAKNGWELAVGNALESDLETSSNPKLPETSLPTINTGKSNGYEIAKARAGELLKQSSEKFLVDYKEVTANPEKYYLVSYWPDDAFIGFGHLKGSVQYLPKKSLKPEAGLLTLPTEKPVVVYCYTGHHSAHATAFLQMLGYNAYSLLYGANSFAHNKMQHAGFKPTQMWIESHKNNFPLVAGQQKKTPAASDLSEVKSVQGGC